MVTQVYKEVGKDGYAAKAKRSTLFVNIAKIAVISTLGFVLWNVFPHHQESIRLLLVGIF